MYYELEKAQKEMLTWSLSMGRSEKSEFKWFAISRAGPQRWWRVSQREMGWNIVQESQRLCSQGRGARGQVQGVDRQTQTVI